MSTAKLLGILQGLLFGLGIVGRSAVARCTTTGSGIA